MKNLLALSIALAIGVSGSGVSALYAPSESASIVGTVSDASVAIVPGATVTIRNDRTNATFTVQSGSDGNFSSPPLPTGPFTVSAEHEGFKRIVQTVNLDVDQRARM